MFLIVCVCVTRRPETSNSAVVKSRDIKDAKLVCHALILSIVNQTNM